MENLFNKIPLTRKLMEIASRDISVFHIPGHGQLRNKSDFSKEQREVLDYLKIFSENMYSLDITEISETDNLQNPKNVIKHSIENLKNDLEKEFCFLLVNGTTCGNLSNIHALNNPKDKVIIENNCHKSVFNAVNICNLKTVTIENEIDDIFKIPKPISYEKLESALKENLDVSSVILTSPTYYGQTIDIDKIYKLCDKYNVNLILDSAHGAHFAYIDSLKSNLEPKFKGKTPLLYTLSYHKTMPCLTQCSVILGYADEDTRQKIQNSVNIFQSTSPSYLFMSSILYSHELGKKYFSKIYKDLKENITEFKNSLKNISNIKILENSDFTRLVISIDNLSGFELEDILQEKYNIILELANEKSIVLVCNVFTTKSDLNNLKDAVMEVSKMKFAKKSNHTEKKQGTKIISENTKIIPISESLGKFSAENIVIYPPGTVLIKKGDIITKKHIDILLEYVKNNRTIIYTENHENNMISVLN